MVIIVLMLVSFAVIGVMVVAVFVTAQKESARSRVAEKAAPDLASAFRFAVLERGDPRIDDKVSNQVRTLRHVLVSDYLQSVEIRRAVDESLAWRGNRGDLTERPEREPS
jgi:hypothetical protein